MVVVAAPQAPELGGARDGALGLLRRRNHGSRRDSAGGRWFASLRWLTSKAILSWPFAFDAAYQNLLQFVLIISFCGLHEGPQVVHPGGFSEIFDETALLFSSSHCALHLQLLLLLLRSRVLLWHRLDFLHSFLLLLLMHSLLLLRLLDLLSALLLFLLLLILLRRWRYS